MPKAGSVLTLVLVALGGVVGASARHLLTIPATEVVGILLANVLGSCLLGIVVYEERTGGRLSRRGRLFLTSGVLSSFTTYSTFALQVATAAGPLEAGAVILANYGLGLVGVLVGRSVGRSLGDAA